MSEEIKFDLDGDIIMQIEMDSYMKYNDTIASMNDHLGEIYGYSDVRDTEEAQLKYEKELAYKAIVQLQQKVEQLEKIRKEAIKYILKNKLYRFKYDDEELFEITTDKKTKDDLLNILNKGSDKDGNNTNETSTGKTEK